MTKFLAKRLKNAAAYVPGEQPSDQKYIKLNTNELPFPPSAAAQSVLREFDFENLRLYSSPNPISLKKALADFHDVSVENITISNGSDEMLAFALMAFCSDGDALAFADITYGLYSVLAKLYGLKPVILPVRDNFSIDVGDYKNLNSTIIIANPNAPTGLALTAEKIEEVLKNNPNSIVIVDEAYADFAPNGTSAVEFVKKYKNLVVVRTFSKSRALAGARIGYAVGAKGVVEALELVRCSFNPYNLDALAIAAGTQSVLDNRFFKKCVAKIIETRDWFARSLEAIGFDVVPSSANFVFVKHNSISGKEIFDILKEEKILVRRWDAPRIEDYLRITIGTKIDMNKLLKVLNTLQ